jgi:hypothetical protein
MRASPCPPEVESLPPIGLEALEASASLLDRVDSKYVVALDDVAALVDRLGAGGEHAVLEIGGRRAFRYRTTYLDSAGLALFRDHVQGRRRRYKCRVREYADSGARAFEVKLKGVRGRTVKHRIAYDGAGWERPSAAALAFLRSCVEGAYGRAPLEGLAPVLAMTYTRVTLVAPALGERVTCDFDLAFSAADGTSGRLAEELAIVETKSRRGASRADRELRALDARPESGCSKYCLGVGFTHPGVKANGLRPLLRRHFRAAPLAAALALGVAAPAAADVPRLDLRTAATIRDDPKVPARMTVGGRTYRVGIELRGEASQLYPKKPYAIEARRRVSLLGMPAERDWVLNAAYTDPTLLRDVLAHRAARRIGLVASRTRHVELRLNGRPRGVYVLMESAELSRRRVRGEALLELTERRKLDRGDEWFASGPGLAVRYAEPDEAREEEARAARRAVRAFEAALGGPGWRAHLDEASAVDYMLLTELLKNQDAFVSSTYLHHRADGKLAFGPLWDFDLSAGNTVEPTLAPPEGWLLPGRHWAGALLADSGFRAAFAARWRALRAAGFVAGLLRDADRLARALGPAARRNFARWRTLERAVFRNQVVHGSHAAAVAAVKDWIARRAAWMDGALGR